jgi:hypothetical protein
MLYLAALFALHLQPLTPDVPNRQPQLAASHATVAIAFGSGTGIYVARSTDNGRTFGAPAKIADVTRMALGRHRGPRVVIAGNTMVVSAITGETGNLMAWRSSDNGKTWSKPVVVNDQPKAAEEGLHSMSADADGNLAAIWLDDRSAPGKRLFGAFSKDGGATWSKNVMLYESPAGTICECCHPSLLALGKGEFAAMWRNKLDGSRDFYVLRVRDGKATGNAVKQGQGTWKLEACPMDGGGIALSKGQLVTAWRREKEVYLYEPGKPEVKLATGQDIALAANTKGTYAIWTAGKTVEARVPSSVTTIKLSDSGAFPSLIALPDGAVLAAWEENGAIATQRLE